MLKIWIKIKMTVIYYYNILKYYTKAFLNNLLDRCLSCFSYIFLILITVWYKIYRKFNKDIKLVWIKLIDVETNKKLIFLSEKKYEPIKRYYYCNPYIITNEEIILSDNGKAFPLEYSSIKDGMFWKDYTSISLKIMEV